MKCPDLELNVLMSIEDVTAPRQRRRQSRTCRRPRRSPPAAPSWPTIEKESLEKTGLRSDVVTLYQGGRITSTATRSTPTSAWCSPSSEATVFSRSVRPGWPDTKTSSSSFAPALLHFR